MSMMPVFTSPPAPVPLPLAQPGEARTDLVPPGAGVNANRFAGILANVMGPPNGDDSNCDGAPPAADDTSARDDGPSAAVHSADATTPRPPAKPPTASDETAPAESSTDALRALIERVVGDTAEPADDAAKPPKAADAADAAAAVAAAGVNAARSGAAIDPTLVVRDLSALQPQFREKIERVIERMKSEYGHDVTIAETWRSQTRQDALHEQGRTKPGAVVTWTRRSQHAAGLAADLVVDGSYDNAQGYRDLMKVAAEEGLESLGPRDPGHLQLAGGQAAAKLSPLATITEVGVTGSAQLRPATTPPRVSVGATGVPPRPVPAELRAAADAPAAIAGLARTAQVAQVAQLAKVAPVAAIAPAAIPGAPATAFAPGAQSEQRREQHGRDHEREPSRGKESPSAVAAATREVDGTGAARSEAAFAALAATRADTSTAPIAALHGSDAAQRAAQVLALQDELNAQPMSHMLLKLDNPDGGLDRIRVDLRGTSVGATMDVQDPLAASQMANRVQELTRPLESRGLDAGALRVRIAAAAGATPSADLARAAAASGDFASLRLSDLLTNAASSSARTRDDSPGQRQQQDAQRHRSRKEQQGGTP
jgi:hypothetical protein